MDGINVRKRGIGVTLSEERTRVCLWAPFAESVSIRMQDVGAPLPLNKGERGYWTLEHDIAAGEQYKFLLNGKELPDPVSLCQPSGVHGPSEAVDLQTFAWTDESWKNIPLEEYIFYELHTGTFTADGTFGGIAQQLKYLKELGINAIEIMPVGQFPGARNWGYDGVFPFATQNSYGGARQLQKLVDECHREGLAVVLDVVYNHMGPEGNYLNEFGPYFTDKYKTPWGMAINFDDAGCDEVRRFFIENTLMWLRDFHIDALRFDAVHAIRDFGPKHILQEIREYVDLLMDTTGRRHYLIVECDLNDTRFINPVDKCGYGMDAQWSDEFHHSLRVAAGNQRTGYYADFDGVPHLAKAYRDGYVYDGIYSPHRLKTFGNKATDNPGRQFVVFSQNHDQVGNRMMGERSSMLMSFEMQKLAAGAVMVSPYLPLLFMGEEWAAPSPFLYFISHSDEALVTAVREGRKREFSFAHGAEPPDPQSEATFNRCKLQWHLLQEEPHKTMFLYYKTLIALRKKTPALSCLNRKNILAEENAGQRTIIIRRWHKEQTVVCLMNFSKEVRDVAFNTEGKKWQKIFDSASPRWRGPADAPGIANDLSVTVQPGSLLIYTNEHV